MVAGSGCGLGLLATRRGGKGCFGHSRRSWRVGGREQKEGNEGRVQIERVWLRRRPVDGR